MRKLTSILTLILIIVFTMIDMKEVNASSSWDMYRMSEGSYTHDKYFIGGWDFEETKYAVIVYASQPIPGQHVGHTYAYGHGKHHYNKGGVMKSLQWGRDYYIEGYEVPLGLPYEYGEMKLHCHVTADRELNCNQVGNTGTPPPHIDPNDTAEQPVPYIYSYLPHRDEYRLDYWEVPEGVTNYQVEFWGSGNSYYENSYSGSPSGTYYLTCNGTYNMNFYNGSELLGSTGEIKTSSLINPACDSYAAEEVMNDLNVNVTELGQGSFLLEWDQSSAAQHYEIYKNGLFEATTGDTSYIADDYGSYTIRAVDATNNTVAESDVNTAQYYNAQSNDDTCNACQQIIDMLSCPEWGAYMGEWSNMIKNSFPNPPYWQGVADIMRDTIVPAMGQELVNRAPEVAIIIADEFESREKPVAPPPALHDFNPDVPQLIDIDEPIIINLDEDIPSFEPDFTESKPFFIPDPRDFEFWEEDAGYEKPAGEFIETVKTYEGNNDITIEPPAYNGNGEYTPPTDNEYNMPAPQPPPPYNPNYDSEFSGEYDYHDIGDMPEYQTNEGEND